MGKPLSISFDPCRILGNARFALPKACIFSVKCSGALCAKCITIYFDAAKVGEKKERDIPNIRYFSWLYVKI